MSYSNNISGLSSFSMRSNPTSTGGATRILAGATRGFANALGNVTGANDLGLLDGFDGGVDNLTDRDLFDMQLRAQRELQKFTMASNLAKTEHDTRMAAVRNMRP